MFLNILFTITVWVDVNVSTVVLQCASGGQRTTFQSSSFLLLGLQELNRSCQPWTASAVTYWAILRSCTLNTERENTHKVLHPQHWQGKHTQGPIPNQEAICNWHLLGKGEWVFSSGVSPSVSAVLQGRPHTQESWDNTERTPWVYFFQSFFALFLFVLLFCLIVFTLVSIFSFWEREKAWSWLGREVERIWEELEEEKP